MIIYLIIMKEQKIMKKYNLMIAFKNNLKLKILNKT